MQINYEASTSSAIPITFDVEVGARLQLALNLKGQTEAHGFDPTDSEKIVALATAALDLAAANFPILRESTWLTLLDAQHQMAGNHLHVVRNAPRPQQYDCFEWLFSESANFSIQVLSIPWKPRNSRRKRHCRFIWSETCSGAKAILTCVKSFHKSPVCPMIPFIRTIEH